MKELLFNYALKSETLENLISYIFMIFSLFFTLFKLVYTVWSIIINDMQ